jgi:hypothetical protein
MVFEQIIKGFAVIFREKKVRMMTAPTPPFSFTGSTESSALLIGSEAAPSRPPIRRMDVTIRIPGDPGSGLGDGTNYV